MLIEKHHKINHLRAELCRSQDFRWMAQIHSGTIEALIFSAANTAHWISAERRDLLEKDSLKVLVIGSPLDCFDSGAWWTCLAHFLGKPLNWAQFCILHRTESSIDRSGLVPASLTSMRLTRVFNKQDVFINELKDADIVFSHILSPTGLSNISSEHQNLVSEFMQRGGAFLSLFPRKWAGTVCTATGEVLGFQSKMTEARYCVSTSGDEDDALKYMVATTYDASKKPFDDCYKLVSDVEELIDVIDDLCTPNPFGGLVEECEFWGMRTLLKSSVDDQDFFITMPRKLIMRERTGKVMEVKNDLAYGDTGMTMHESAMKEYAKTCSSLLGKIRWAAAAWDSGIGDRRANTLGGMLESHGYDKDQPNDFIESMAKEAGLSDSMAKRLLAGLTGGEPYAPRKDERVVFDKLKRGDLNGVLSMVQQDIGLCNSFNERREPLLLEMAKRGMVDGMHALISFGADVDALDGGGRAIVTEASRFAPKEAVEVLLEEGCDVNHRDVLGWSAILAALTSGKWDVASMLLDYGADTELPNSAGLTAKNFVLGIPTQGDELLGKMSKFIKEFDGFDIDKMLAGNGYQMNGSSAPGWLKEKILAH